MGGGRSNVLQTGVYGSYRWGNAYLSSALAYGYYRTSTDRMITIAGSDTLTAGFNAQDWAGRVEGGYRFNTAWFAITPYSAYQPQAVHVPSYGESALSGSNTYALNYQARTATMSRVELGSWFDKTFTIGADLFWRCALAPPGRMITAAIPPSLPHSSRSRPRASRSMAPGPCLTCLLFRPAPSGYGETFRWPAASTVNSPSGRRPTRERRHCAICGERRARALQPA